MKKTMLVISMLCGASAFAQVPSPEINCKEAYEAAQLAFSLTHRPSGQLYERTCADEYKSNKVKKEIQETIAANPKKYAIYSCKSVMSDEVLLKSITDYDVLVIINTEQRQKARQKLAQECETQWATAQLPPPPPAPIKPDVRIGMTQSTVIEQTSWGEPEKINRTTTSSGVREQWVYGTGNYLYFTNGKLTAIQN